MPAVREGPHETVGTVPTGDSAIDKIMVPQGGHEVSLRDAKFFTLKALRGQESRPQHRHRGTNRLQLINIIVEQISAGEGVDGDGEDA